MRRRPRAENIRCRGPRLSQPAGESGRTERSSLHHKALRADTVRDQRARWHRRRFHEHRAAKPPGTIRAAMSGVHAAPFDADASRCSTTLDRLGRLSCACSARPSRMVSFESVRFTAERRELVRRGIRSFVGMHTDNAHSLCSSQIIFSLAACFLLFLCAYYTHKSDERLENIQQNNNTKKQNENTNNRRRKQHGVLIRRGY